jgi:hypothetical protein
MGSADGAVLKASSVAAHLTIIRARYRHLLRRDGVRDAIL